MTDHRARARALAEEALRRGDAVGWFETLYREVDKDWARIPWADLTPNPHVAEWLAADAGDRSARTALVVGCGLGDDAEAVAARGYRVVAFDVASTAIEGCRRRYPETRVEYRVADLFDPPSDWAGGFDLVVEVNTLQVLPDARRVQAMGRLADFVAPGGTLLVVARGREENDDPGRMPWPLTRRELRAFAGAGLEEERFEDFLDDETPPVRRFRATWRRPGEGRA